MIDERPVTKADLDAALGNMRGELRGEIRASKAELDSALGNMRDELLESIRDSQTEILRGFEGLIRSSDARLQRLELGAQAMGGSEVLLNTRLSAVESRLFEIEKKLLQK